MLSNDDKVTRTQLLTLGVLSVLVVWLVFLLIRETDKAVEHSSEDGFTIVNELFGEALSTDSGNNLPVVDYSKFIEGASADSGNELEGFNHENRAMHEVFGTLNSGYETYVLENISARFCKITLRDSDGERTGIPAGFWYETNEDQSKLTGWRVCRLLPFSVYDEEYSEVWYDLYK